jgi:hypothetical protein
MMTRVWFGVAMMATSLALSGCGGDDDGGAGSQAGAGGGGGASGGGSQASSPCAELCDISAPLACPGDNPATCLAECEQMWGLSSCNDELRALLSCMAQVPQSNWECEAGTQEATVKAGFCDAENAAVKSCLAASP